VKPYFLNNSDKIEPNSTMWHYISTVFAIALTLVLLPPLRLIIQYHLSILLYSWFRKAAAVHTTRNTRWVLHWISAPCKYHPGQMPLLCGHVQPSCILKCCVAETYVTQLV